MGRTKNHASYWYRSGVFMLDKDGYSLRVMADLYKSLPIDSALKDRFDAARKHINGVLSRSIINDTRIGHIWTFGFLIDMYMYGEVVHTDPKKRAYVKYLEEPTQSMHWYFFWRGFHSVVDAILHIREVNNEAVKELNLAYPMVKAALKRGRYMTKAHEVAEHILAKIDEIVQSGDIDDMDATVGESSKRDYATARLDVYMKILDAVTRYAAVEPKKPGKAVSF